MYALFHALFRSNKKKPSQKKLNATTAKKVLQFLAHGLIYGAESLASRYPPGTKVGEFVAVSGSILMALKAHQPHLTDAVLVSVHVNEAQKLLQFMQVGEHVAMGLDGYHTIISLITLDELYLRLRDDILKNEKIYGKELYITAVSTPASR